MKLTLLAFFVFLFSLPVFSLTILGKAFVDGKLTYTEKHRADLRPNGLYQRIETEYLDLNNTPFAVIKSDFEKDNFVPDVDFVDYRFKMKELVKNNAAKKEITIDRTIDKKNTQSSLVLKPNAVLGQGFHNFIVSNFEALKSGPHDVYFVISPRSDQYQFEIQKENEKNGNVEFVVKPANIILRAIIPEIKLTYEASSKRLLVFQGLSNLDGPNGNSQKVVINYSYQ